MEIYRKSAISDTYAELPFVRLGNGSFVDSLDDSGLIKLFRECAEGRSCISELDSENLIMVKVDVPSRVINSKEHSGEIVEWLFYFWKPRDKQHVSDFFKHWPYEAVNLENAGIDTDFLVSIADDSHIYEEADPDGSFWL